MAITDYTTCNSVRAAVGVSTDELEDATITDSIYSTQLDEALYALDPSMAANYATVKDLSNKTQDQTRYVNMVSTWSAYTVCTFLLTSLPMFAPQQIQSEKDAVIRVSDPYKDIRAGIEQTAGTLAERIMDLYVKLYPSTPIPVKVDIINVAAISLPVDPVTG